MPSNTAAQGWLLRHLSELLFLPLLVFPSSTVASRYTYGQIFLDTSRLLACCFNRERTIYKYPKSAAENCCFHVPTVLVYGLSFPYKGGSTTANNCTFPALPHFRPQTYNVLWVKDNYNMAIRETKEKNQCIQFDSCHLKILLQKLRGH
jgi:hypothetical protein